MTTNCIQRPQEIYAPNLFTRGLVGWPGITHIPDLNFKPVIDKALAMPGFAEDSNGKSVMIGFARNAVLGVAGAVIEAVKNKQIRHFFLVGGCDGAKPTRNYYTEFVEKVPKDCVVLTLACGKFRFFDKEMGDIGGIPRLLDVGQCNDAYSAVQIAVALANAFGVGVNDLPLSMILFLVRAEGRGHPADAALPGHQEHPPGTEPPGLHHPQRPGRAGEKLRHQTHHHPG